MKKKLGFTLPELLVVIAFTTLILVFFFLQKTSIDAMNRDNARKEAINSMYYALEEGYYASNGYYPETISEENLKVVNPKLFTDPMGINLGKAGCSYVYEAGNCEDGKCKEYTLSAALEKEDKYIKKSRTHNGR